MKKLSLVVLEENRNGRQHIIIEQEYGTPYLESREFMSTATKFESEQLLARTNHFELYLETYTTDDYVEVILGEKYSSLNEHKEETSCYHHDPSDVILGDIHQRFYDLPLLIEATIIGLSFLNHKCFRPLTKMLTKNSLNVSVEMSRFHDGHLLNHFLFTRRENYNVLVMVEDNPILGESIGYFNGRKYERIGVYELRHILRKLL